MKTFFDSSAFAKRYIKERGSHEVWEICEQATSVALSVICVPEIVSAFNRRLREGALTPEQYREAKIRLSTETTDIAILYLAPPVISRAIRVLETNSVRAMDALHVACALQWKSELFVSSAERQLGAAEKLGLRVRRA